MSHDEHRFAGVRALFFDLDGTLIDSRLDLAASVNATLAHLGRTPLADEIIFSCVGKGAPALVERVLGEGAAEEEVRRGLDYFLSYYGAHMLDHTVVYPGVREGLERLKERELAVLTNKPVRFSKRILEGLGMARHFRVVYGGNSFETKKPDPQGANALLRDLGVSPLEAMMVGDSDVDVRTARNAGTWACGVTYGLGAAGLDSCPPDLLLDSLADLSAHLNGSAAEE